MPDGNHGVTFTSCDAGTRSTELVEDSVVDLVNKAIVDTWPEAKPTVKGARGPSVKTTDAQGKEHWGVVGAGEGDAAGQMQGMLNAV
jgi:hypothetical protein